VELQPGVSETDANAAIVGVIRKHTDDKDMTEAFLYPLSKCYLYSSPGKDAGGPIETLRIFTVIAGFIVLIACINFMNLTTAQSSRFAKEVGVRKAIGARRSSLIRRFIFESIVVSTAAAMLALMIVWVGLPYFNTLTGTFLVLNFGSAPFWIALSVFVLFTGFLAGSYPAFYLSSFLPVKVLKGVFKGGHDFAKIRKILIIVQFALANLLIISTFIVHRQVRYAQNRDMGYDKSRLIYLMLSDEVKANYQTIRNEILDSGIAESMTFTFGTMTGSWSKSWDVEWRGKNTDEPVNMERFYVDADWAKTTGVKILQGRDIDIYTYPTDQTAVLLNESAVRRMGFTDPIGEIIRETGKEWHVVGVVQDFILDSPYQPVSPMTIGGPAGWFNHIHIKLSSAGGIANNLKRLEALFKKYNPDHPFTYYFADEDYVRKFSAEQRLGTMVTWFAALVIFIACLGLFGLSSFMAENRRKEIGIRKVMGASVMNVVNLPCKEFVILITVSIIIATPVAWFLGDLWLNAYPYRTNISPLIFILVGLIGLSVALLTVGFQAIRAAMANPVKAIKSE
jgi:ABC-type antimicrobial peptide transport system permease subunit